MTVVNASARPSIEIVAFWSIDGGPYVAINWTRKYASASPPDAAEGREDCAFGDELPDDARPCRAESYADCDFPAPRGGLGEHEIRYVRGCHEEYKSDSREQEIHRGTQRTVGACLKRYRCEGQTTVFQQETASSAPTLPAILPAAPLLPAHQV